MPTIIKHGPPSGFSTPPPHRPPGQTNAYANTKCPLCGVLGHSKQRCYEVIGYPDWWDFTKQPRKNLEKAIVATTEDEHPSSASANVAQSGMKGNVSMNSSWIIDTGASDHMTRVDCASKINTKLCNNFSVSHYPMLFWGPPSKFVSAGWEPKQEKSDIQVIGNGRTADLLLSWINKQMGSSFGLEDRISHNVAQALSSLK